MKGKTPTEMDLCFVRLVLLLLLWSVLLKTLCVDNAINRNVNIKELRDQITGNKMEMD